MTLLLLSLLLPGALAATPPQVHLAAGLVGGAGLGDSAGGLGGVTGALGVAIAPDRPAVPGLVFRVREGFASGEPRTVGALAADLRWPAAPGPHAFVGFAHHHETDLAIAIDHPVASALATHTDIVHRTGLEAGAGLEFPSPWPDTAFAGRLRPAVATWVVMLPGSEGPPVYVGGEVTCTLRLGRAPG